jgi:5-(carboxyamino)imidazole ribonucleotide synthase
LVGLPLPEPVQHSPATMVNLLGDLWWPQGDASAAPTKPPWDRLLALPGTHLHLYGKLSARPGRKMGHLNITGASVAQVRETTEQVLALLGLPSMQALAS